MWVLFREWPSYDYMNYVYHHLPNVWVTWGKYLGPLMEHRDSHIPSGVVRLISEASTVWLEQFSQGNLFIWSINPRWWNLFFGSGFSSRNELMTLNNTLRGKHPQKQKVAPWKEAVPRKKLVSQLLVLGGNVSFREGISSRQFIATSAEVTPKGSLAYPKWPKHSG